MDESKFIELLDRLVEGEAVSFDGATDSQLAILKKIEEKLEKCHSVEEMYNSLQARLEKLLDVLVEFAQFNFSMEIPLSENADELDGIALGLQTLGQEVEYYQSQLQLSNENLIEAQSMAKIGSWEIKVPTMDMLWSDQLYEIYGIKERGNEWEQVVEKINDRDNIELTRLMDRAIQYHEPYTITFEATVDDKVKFIHAQAKPVFENGEVVKVVGTAMDVTERVLSQKKLEKLNVELEQKVVERTKDLEGFSYTVSHDLRAPLRSIIGFSNILEDAHGDQLDDEARRVLSIIVKNAQKMSTLIEELLTFSRVGVTVAKFDPLDLNEVIESTWKDVVSPFEQKDLVEFNCVELPTIFGTSSMIQQVFTNLLSNALKYSSKEEKIQISITVKEEVDDFVDVVIADNGCGFNMKYHDKLFGVFQRLHSEDEFSGTGVGLALVKRIVDKHQGKIWAESEVGKGSTFFVRLPKTQPMLL